MVRSGAVKTILRLFAVLLTALLALALVRQTAFAKTYVITDGDRVVTYTTFATDPAEVLDQAGLTLEQYDTYTTQTGEGVEEITICRSQRVTVDYHGEEMTVTTFGETAGELLSRLNLEVGGVRCTLPRSGGSDQRRHGSARRQRHQDPGDLHRRHSPHHYLLQ